MAAKWESKHPAIRPTVTVAAAAGTKNIISDQKSNFRIVCFSPHPPQFGADDKNNMCFTNSLYRSGCSVVGGDEQQDQANGQTKLLCCHASNVQYL